MSQDIISGIYPVFKHHCSLLYIFLRLVSRENVKYIKFVSFERNFLTVTFNLLLFDIFAGVNKLTISVTDKTCS